MTKLGKMRLCHWRLGYWMVPAVLLVSGVADAAPLHVRDSTPAAEAIVHGRHAEYVIRFDGPVDHVASRIEIMQSGRVVQSLTPRVDSAVDVLFASGETPAAGHYVLHWQARSPEGDISNGDIAFSVAP